MIYVLSVARNQVSMLVSAWYDSSFATQSKLIAACRGIESYLDHLFSRDYLFSFFFSYSYSFIKRTNQVLNNVK